MILLPYKGHVPPGGAAFVLSYSLSYGLIALGLMGYPNNIARDRDKGVFQRLRVAPIPTWAIMGSRLLVQVVMILIITLAIFIVGNQVDKIALSTEGYVLTFLTAIICAAFYLSLGQLIVALIKNPDTVNSTSRFTFLFFILVGTFANIFQQKGELPHMWVNILHWWPYGTINTVLAASMAPEKWDLDVTYALLATIGYIALFLVIGMRKFTWETK